MGYAQSVMKMDVLMQTSTNLALDARANFARAVMVAKQNGWPIRYASRNQNSAKLMGVDAKGWPKYYVSLRRSCWHAITIGANKVWPWC